jgi:hypothetical protein
MEFERTLNCEGANAFTEDAVLAIANKSDDASFIVLSLPLRVDGYYLWQHVLVRRTARGGVKDLVLWILDGWLVIGSCWMACV